MEVDNNDRDNKKKKEQARWNKRRKEHYGRTEIEERKLLKGKKTLQKKRWKKRMKERLAQERAQHRDARLASKSQLQQREGSGVQVPRRDAQEVHRTAAHAATTAARAGKEISEKTLVGAAQRPPWLKEIDPSQIVRTPNLLGSGTFGCCYLGLYRRISVAVKELKLEVVGKETPEDAVDEAQVLTRLGDHRGLPLLFGVCSKAEPFSLVL